MAKWNQRPFKLCVCVIGSAEAYQKSGDCDLNMYGWWEIESVEVVNSTTVKCS